MLIVEETGFPAQRNRVGAFTTPYVWRALRRRAPYRTNRSLRSGCALCYCSSNLGKVYVGGVYEAR